MTCEEGIAALQEAKNIFCSTGSKGIILAKIKIKLKVLVCCDEEDGGGTTTTTTSTTTTTTTTEEVTTSTTTVDESPGLRMVFGSLGGGMPSNLSDWNTFFDLPTNGTPFTSMWVSGNQVTLVGGGSMTIRATLFFTNTNILQIFDDTNIVDLIEHTAFNSATSLTDANFDAATTIGTDGWGGAFHSATSLVNVSLANAETFLSDSNGTFEGCSSIVNLSLPSALLLPGAFIKNATSLETFSAPLATDLGSNGMENCTSITTIDLTSCVNLGSSPSDASVFAGITGQVITLTIAAVNETNNSLAPHASIAALLAANPGSIINYI